MLGFVIAGGVLMIMFFVGVANLIDSAKNEFTIGKKEVAVKTNSVYHIKFNQEIDERAAEDPFDGLDLGPFAGSYKTSLRDIVESINYAATDKNIEGIFMEVDGFPGGLSKMEEVRNALLKFKESGKWIVSYSEGYSQGAYYLNSVADKIYMYPEGNIFFKGLATNIMYMKGLLEKMDIEMQAIKGPGNIYKSAVEPLTADEMSEANRIQIKAYLSSIWEHWLQGISDERGVSVIDLNNYADNLSVNSAEQAVKLGLVDDLLYRDEVLKKIMSRIGIEEEKEMQLVAFSKYKSKKVSTRKEGSTRINTKKVAVIYANGEIRSGKGSDGVMGSDDIAAAIKKARQDTNVKAIVLRVNSPGGSALASDVMWRETILAKAEKPFIVSMGDLAASGGYYISSNADKIYANETTITGSIGVFGLMPVTEKFFKNKLGISFYSEQTNSHSTFPNGINKLDAKEYEVVNDAIIDIYEDFVTKVAAGRGLTVDQVKEVAKGRVWTGEDALGIGLVDEIGDLNDAIAYAVKEAGLDSYRVYELPKLKDPFEQMFSNFGVSISSNLMKETLGANYKYLRIFNEVENMKGVQARLPYSIDVY